ncbi:GTP-binding protein [Pelagibius litoralis]|uniref:GTP-binding protein n=1 Tax=Pelagibius litoralis TaxID=374515 RepID=A0A967F1J6_9PROT|nr:Rab family GTPase [Pelagibius litoralis]NIA71394.1 GTP-binding protein [Pelagibius litoralis]
MTISKKICIVGAFAVGKSSLVRRYVLKEFTEDYQATLGVNVYKYVDQVETLDGGLETVSQILWDIEGSQQKVELLNTYLRGAAGALVVGDVTRPDALESMAAHAEHFLKVQPGRPVVFALNKVDLLDSVESAPDGRVLTDQFGGRALHTSAATGAAVPELFHVLASRILEIGA